MGTTKPVHPQEQTNGPQKPADETSASNPASSNQSLTRQTPLLQINTYELVFPTKAVGRPHFMTFTLAQQHADTPVTISTDSPELFQLASDSRPAFAPSLTLIPPPKATYIHVRYAPARAGKHSAQLIIEAPYGSETIQLEARSTGFLPAMIPGPVVTVGQQPTQRNRWRTIVSLFVAGCLLLAGYRYRCQLAPSLCREPASLPTEQQTLPPAKTPPRTEKRTGVSKSKIGSRSRSAGRSSRNKTRASARAKRVESTTGAEAINAPTETVGQTPGSQETVPQANARPAGRAGRPRSATLSTLSTGQPASQRPADSSPSRRRTNKPPVNEESDLERELNKKPDNP